MGRFGGIHIENIDLTSLNDAITLDITDWNTVQIVAGAGTFNTARLALECSGDVGITWLPVLDGGAAAIVFSAPGMQPAPQVIGVTQCRLRVATQDAGAESSMTIHFNLKK